MKKTLAGVGAVALLVGVLLACGGGGAKVRRTHALYEGLTQWERTEDGKPKYDHKYVYDGEGHLERVELRAAGTPDYIWSWVRSFSKKDIVASAGADAPKLVSDWREQCIKSGKGDSYCDAVVRMATDIDAAKRTTILSTVDYEPTKNQYFEGGTLQREELCDYELVAGRVMNTSFKKVEYRGGKPVTTVEESCRYVGVDGTARMVGYSRFAEGKLQKKAVFDASGRLTSLDEYEGDRVKSKEQFTYAAGLIPESPIALSCESCVLPLASYPAE